MTTFMQLAEKTEAELNKMTKTEILAAIKNQGFMAASYKRRAEEMEKQISDNNTNERAACVMLAALVGKELTKNEYTGQIESRDLNILELVGLVSAKCVESAKAAK